MQKGKFVKRNKAGTTKTSKDFSVEDMQGNQHFLKATVIGVERDLKKSETSALIDEEMDQLGLEGRVIQPPLSPGELSRLWEFSSELGQTIDAMEIGIEGFGGRVIERKVTDEQEK